MVWFPPKEVTNDTSNDSMTFLTGLPSTHTSRAMPIVVKTGILFAIALSMGFTKLLSPPPHDSYAYVSWKVSVCTD